jgi:hypothetical protein
MPLSLAGFVLLTGIATVPLQAQRDAKPTAPQPAGAGRIAGSVVDAESGRAVRFATVTLSGNGERKVVTDDGGRFSFDRLASGSYRLQVSKPGFLETAYGQVRPGTETSGAEIPLKEREEIQRIVIPLSRGGAISGVVRDDRGDPVFGATVRVSRRVWHNGVGTLDTVATANTDERGVYRVPLLPPRLYVVSAEPPEDHAKDEHASDRRQSTGFAPIFYQAAASAHAAAAVPIRLGEDRPGVDLQLPLVTLARITGVVLDADGRPASAVEVALDPGSFADGREQTARTEADGRFTFDDVVPGSYVVTAGGGGHREFKVSYMKLVGDAHELDLELSATRQPAWHLAGGYLLSGNVRVTEGRRENAARGMAVADVSVTGGTVSELVLTLEPLRTVSGRVTFEGTSPTPTGLLVTLAATTGSTRHLNAKLGEDGTFSVSGVAPGRYSVGIEGQAAPWTLASGTAGGTDVLDRMLDVPRDRDVSDLTLAVRDVTTEVSGTVTDGSSKPAGNRTVIAFAVDETLWAAGTHRIQAVGTTFDGRFAFTNLRPGTYWLAVTEPLEPAEWLDPEVLRQLVGGAVPVTLGPGERKVQDLRAR